MQETGPAINPQASKHRSLPRALVIGFTLTFAALLVSVSIYFIALQTVMESNRNLVFNHVDELISGMELKFSAERKVAQNRAYLLTANKKFMAEAQSSHREFVAKGQALGQQIEGAEASALLQEINRVELLHHGELEFVFRELQQNPSSDRATLFDTRIKPRWDDLDRSLNKFLQFEQTQVEAGKARSLAADKRSKQLALIGTALSLLSFASLVALVWRTIHRLQKADRLRILSAEEAAASRRLFETVLEQMPAAVIIGEAPAGKLIFANNKVKNIWGKALVGLEEINEYAAWNGFHADGRRYAAQDWPLARSISLGETVVSEETRIERGDGSFGYFRLSSAPVRNETGHIVAGVVICEDFTERKRLEKVQIELTAREQAASEASQLKSMFLANMSHEIRTPISGVIGMTELLSSTELSRYQRDIVADITISANVLLTVISGILDFSKIEAGKLEFESAAFDLPQLLRHLAKSFALTAREKKLDLAIRHSVPAPACFRGDEGRVRQILTNLISNALKFTAQGSVQVDVTTKPMSDTWVELHFSVRDTGEGVEAGTLQRLFTPFVQADSSTSRRYGGTGLGLSICKKLVEAMGGQIGVRSQPGLGSEFWFSIRLEAVDAAELGTQEEFAAASSQPLAGKRILVAEDNPINQKVAQINLEKIGCHVQLVSGGYAALQALEAKDFDLALMDCQMPDLDGYETTRRIRAKMEGRNARIPIIAVTASSIKGDRERCLHSGMNDYLSKPYRTRELIRVLSSWLELAPTIPAVSSADSVNDLILDPAVLESLKELAEGAGPKLLPELLEIFRATMLERLAIMHAAASRSDLSTLQFEAHALKSAGGNLGAIRIAKLCQTIEDLQTLDRKEEIEKLLLQLSEEFRLAAACMEVEFGRDQQPRAV